MAREFSRTRRVGEQMQRDLAELIRSEIKDPRVGMVTLSGVEVSRDLAHAKVFFTVLGDATQQHDSLAVLQRAAGFLRGRLGKQMTLRTVPELHFLYDDTLDKGMRLDALIDSAVAEDEARHHDKPESE